MIKYFSFRNSLLYCLKAASLIFSKVVTYFLYIYFFTYYTLTITNKMYLSFAIFDETTYAVIQSYFSNESSASGCLKVFNTWRTISNSKTQYSLRNYLGNAAVHGDKNVKTTDKGDTEISEHHLHDVVTLSSKLDTIFLSESSR